MSRTVRRLMALVLIAVLLTGCETFWMDRTFLYSKDGCMLYIDGPEVQNAEVVDRAMQLTDCNVLWQRDDELAEDDDG